MSTNEYNEATELREAVPEPTRELIPMQNHLKWLDAIEASWKPSPDESSHMIQPN